MRHGIAIIQATMMMHNKINNNHGKNKLDSRQKQIHIKLPLRSSRIVSLKGDVAVPGDKSISHRSLLLSSQFLGTTHISGLLEGDDVLNTAKALRALGVVINQQAGHIWEVQGVGIGG